MKPGKILNPATGKYVNIDGAIGKKLKGATEMYHIFGYNHDIPSEILSVSVPETEINRALAGFCTEYYEILQWVDEEKWVVPKRLAKLAASTSDADTLKLIKLVKKLSIELKTYCKQSGGCDNKANIIIGIVKGGDMR
jgi:hypothetical protein